MAAKHKIVNHLKSLKRQLIILLQNVFFFCKVGNFFFKKNMKHENRCQSLNQQLTLKENNLMKTTFQRKTKSIEKVNC